MNLSGQYFYYNGKSSARYGLKIMHLDTERISQLSGEVEYRFSYSRHARKIQSRQDFAKTDKVNLSMGFRSG